MFRLDAPLEPAIAAYCDPEGEDATQKTSLNNIVMQLHRNVPMEKLVEKLGPYLTHADGHARQRATLLLAEVLHRLPELPLSTSAAALLLNFFTERLRDFPSADACLQALLALETHHASKLPSPASSLELVHKVVTSLHVPQLGQAMRKQCFELMQAAVQRPEVVKLLLTEGSEAGDGSEPADSPGKMFVLGFLNSMEGEKDPRNLLLCLQVARELATRLEPVFERHEELRQQYFDVISCYFPITFTPPPNDPYGITTEELILSLRRALAASSLFAAYVLPFLLEKLSSTPVMEAKLDALQTLVFCGDSYSVSSMLLHLNAITQSLYYEVVKGEQKEVNEAACAAISRLTTTIGRAKNRGHHGGNYAWSQFVVKLVSRASADLDDNAADSFVSTSAGRTLAAVASDSASGFPYVVDQCMSMLLDKFEASQKQSASACEASLSRIALLVDAIDRDVDRSASEQPMHSHAERLLSVLDTFLQSGEEVHSSSGAKSLAVDAVSHLITYPPSPVVSTSQVQNIVQLLTKLLLLEPASDVRLHCLVNLQAISKTHANTGGDKYAEYVQATTLVQLMEVIQQAPDHDSTRQILMCSRRSHEALQSDVLDATTSLCSEPSIFQAAITRLVSVTLDGGNGQAYFFQSQEADSVLRRRLNKVLAAVAQIVENGSEDKSSMEFCVREGEHGSIVLKLLSAISSTTSSAAEKEEVVDAAKLEPCARIFRTVMQSVEPASQEVLASAAVDKFLAYPVDAMQPAHLQFVPLFSAVVNSCRRGVVLPHTSEVMNRLLELAQAHSSSDSVSKEASLSAAKSLASIVNKMGDGEEFDALIRLLLDTKLSTTIADESADHNMRLAALQIYVWVAKALVIRGHKTHAPACLQFLCRFVTPASPEETSSISMDVAKSFKLLLVEYPDVLNRKCGAVVTLLYSQRTFGFVFPPLLEYVRSRKVDECVPALVAFSHVIAQSPKAAYLPQLPSIFPLLVHAINTDKEELRDPAVHAFKILLFESVDSAKPFLKDIFPGLLLQAQQGGSALARHEALQCVSKLASIPYELVHPYKVDILKNLLKCLDDRKRFVRREAVRVRNQWSVL